MSPQLSCGDLIRSLWAVPTKGVPQSSIIGSLLFNAFMNDLFLLIENVIYTTVRTTTPLTGHPKISQTWWRHQMEIFSALLALCAGNSPVPVNSPHKGQWRGALMFSLIYAWINDWVNNREAGDLRRHRCHYDVIVMSTIQLKIWWIMFFVAHQLLL